MLYCTPIFLYSASTQAHKLHIVHFEILPKKYFASILCMHKGIISEVGMHAIPINRVCVYTDSPTVDTHKSGVLNAPAPCSTYTDDT